MRAFYRHLALSAVAATFISSCSLASAAPLPFLHAQGTQIVDEKGQPVLLRGFNLGGWLMEEMWMSPIVTKPPAGSNAQPIADAVGLWRTVEGRFGKEQAYALKKEWRDDWLNESDFQRIKAAGFNSVRLPFIYDAQNDPDGLFFWLDRAVDWSEKSGLYIILDMHGAPGRQSDAHVTGEVGVNRLFKDPAEVDATAKLWRAIADRYKGRTCVAGYDLLNEPMGAPSPANLSIVHDRLYHAIREVDDRHLIIMEDGYKGFDTLPSPLALGWHDVVLSIHSYDFGAKDADAHIRQADGLINDIAGKLPSRGVPFYLGEFNIEPHGNPEVLNHFVKVLESKGYSWDFWTYKVAGPPGGRSLWGWFYSEDGLKAIDPFTDSPEQMRAKFAAFKTSNMTEYAALKDALLVPPTSSVPILNWKVKNATGAETTPPASTDAGWRDVKINEDVFDNKAGFVWFRATLPAIQGKEKTLSFGAADDNATVYLNGQKLLRHEGWSGSFDVPLDAAWKADGTNEVAVLIENTNGTGGLTGDVNLTYLP